MNPGRKFLAGPTSEQLELVDTAARFLTANYSLEQRRRTIVSGIGFDRGVWAEFADLGWLALPFPEAAGGLGMGPLELAALMTALGQALVLEPYLDAVVLAGTLLAACPAGSLREELIETTITGGGFATVALLEPRRRAPEAPAEVIALPVQGGVELHGHLAFVPFAAQAEMILVPARQHGPRDAEYAVYAVRPAEVQVDSYRTVDGGMAADIALTGVRISGERLMAGPREAPAALAQAIRVATFCVCAEAVAIMDKLIRSTADYLKNRKQFGQALANFQALQHMLADMAIAHAHADAATWAAGHFLDSADSVLRDRLLAAAKFEVGRTGRYIGQRAVHLHGGIGMTEELIVGHQFKRLLGIDSLYGGRLRQLQQFREPGNSLSWQ
jgi:alkylation response protein AidB-like acyl-CoA dehydrogenase